MGEKDFKVFLSSKDVEYYDKSSKDIQIICDKYGIMPKHLYLKSFEKLLPFNVETEVPIETKTFIDVDNENIIAKIYKDGFASKTVAIMPDIIDVHISENKVVIVTFADGTTEKALLSKNDVFSLEQGISICITKKILQDKCGAGSSMYNKIIKRALNVIKSKEAKSKAILEEKKKREQAEHKAREKRAKQEKAKRERQIEIQKEAYLRAMREYNGTTETKQDK